MEFLKTIKLKNMLMLTIAGIINAIGVTVFISPVNLYDSGISGTSILLSQITPPRFTLSLFLVLLNVPLFIADKTCEYPLSLSGEYQKENAGIAVKNSCKAFGNDTAGTACLDNQRCVFAG